MSRFQVKIKDCKFEVENEKYEKFWESVNRNLWEPETFNILERILKSGATYVDCGTWIGPTVLYAASLGATVEGYECDPVALAVIKKNISYNTFLADRIKLHECALSDSDSIASFYSRQFGNSESSFYRIHDRGLRTHNLKNMTNVICQDARRVLLSSTTLIKEDTLIKIDTEGAEYKILPRIADLVRKSACSFLISFHPQNITLEHNRPKQLARLRMTLEWIDIFWDHCWYAINRNPIQQIDKENFLRKFTDRADMQTILFTRHVVDG